MKTLNEAQRATVERLDGAKTADLYELGLLDCLRHQTDDAGERHLVQRVIEKHDPKRRVGGQS